MFEKGAALHEQISEVSAEALTQECAQKAGRRFEAELVADAGAVVHGCEVTVMLERGQVSSGHDLTDQRVWADHFGFAGSLELPVKTRCAPDDGVSDVEDAGRDAADCDFTEFAGGANLEINTEGEKKTALDRSIDQCGQAYCLQGVLDLASASLRQKQYFSYSTFFRCCLGVGSVG